jgi:hypothetical protein
MSTSRDFLGEAEKNQRWVATKMYRVGQISTLCVPCTQNDGAPQAAVAVWKKGNMD